MAKKDPAGLFILAGLFVGIGIGLLVDKTAVGTLVGLGVGFLIFALIKLLRKK